jgi:hypothetical protein
MRYFYAPGSDAAHAADVARARDGGALEPEYRVLIPARELQHGEARRVPAVGVMAALLRSRPEHTVVDARYARAEEIVTAQLVESVSLRFVLAGGVRGAAVWRDGRWGGALVQGLGGAITKEHLEALITGTQWPPPRDVCVRCGAEARRNADGSMRAHGRKRKCRGYWVSLMDCCWKREITEGVPE